MKVMFAVGLIVIVAMVAGSPAIAYPYHGCNPHHGCRSYPYHHYHHHPYHPYHPHHPFHRYHP